MKKAIGTLLAALLPVLLCISAGAAAYTDPMVSATSDSIRTVSGLKTNTIGGLPYPEHLTFTSSFSPSGYYGSVTYQVTGAEEVIVGIYTSVGSFYGYNDTDYPGISGYVLGIANTARFTWNQTQPSIGMGSDGIAYLYADIGGTPHRLYSYRSASVSRNGPRLFIADVSAPASGLRPYGVSVWSAAGSGESQVSLTRTDATYFSAGYLCYEEFRGKVPQGVQQVRVEINDYGVLHYSDGSGYVEKANRLTSLATLTLLGDNLVMGPKEPENPNPELPGGSGSESSGSSKTSSSRAASSSRASSAASSGTSSKSSSSVSSSSSQPKFEGSVVLSSGTAGSASGSARDTTPSSNKEASPTGEPPPPEAEEPAARAMVYQTGATAMAQRDTFGVAVVAYIVVIAGVLLYVIIRQTKK